MRRYLKQFLWDRRVVEIPRPIWWMILNLIILPFRSKSSAAKYASIWTNVKALALLHTTKKQAVMLKGYLGERGHEVHVTRDALGSPSIPEVLSQLKKPMVTNASSFCQPTLSILQRRRRQTSIQ